MTPFRGPAAFGVALVVVSSSALVGWLLAQAARVLPW